MRRMILPTLVLLPVMAHAQAGTSAEHQPSTFSTMEAELTQPSGLAKLAIEAAATKAAAPSASIATLSTANHAAIREFVQTKMMDDFA